MRRYAFRILNVFAESAWSGNALAVFEDGSGLSDEEMQALALLFNLSETTFLLPSSTAGRPRYNAPVPRLREGGSQRLSMSRLGHGFFNEFDGALSENDAIQDATCPVRTPWHVAPFTSSDRHTFPADLLKN